MSKVAPPEVSSTNPMNGAFGVAIDRQVDATFNVPMDPSTIDAASFTVSVGATAVPGTVIYTGMTATFTPANGTSMVVSPNIRRSRQIEGFWLDWISSDPASSSWNWSADPNQRALARPRPRQRAQRPPRHERVSPDEHQITAPITKVMPYSHSSAPASPKQRLSSAPSLCLTR